MIGFIILLALVVFFIYALKNTQNKNKTNNAENPKDFFYSNGMPMREIKRSDGIVEYASGSGHYVKPYEAFFSGITHLNDRCPDNILTPKDTSIFFAFKENKTKDFPVLLEIVKDDPNLKKEGDEYTLIVPMSDWKKVKSIFDITKKWKSTKILLDGKDVEKLFFSKMLRCLENKDTSRTQKWCDDFYFEQNYPQCIGCRYLGISTLNFDEFLEERENYFRIKKEDVLKIIQEKAQTLKFCPFWDSKKVWEHYLKLIPAISFNDKRFVCIKEKGEIRVEIRHDIYQPLSSIRQYTSGKILSK